MKSKLRILLLVLTMATAHGIGQIAVASFAESIPTTSPTLARLNAAALRFSMRPLGASRMDSTAPSLCLANSLLWGIGAVAACALALASARRLGFIHSAADPIRASLRRARQLLLHHEASVPLMALLFASVANGTLVLARIVWTGNLRSGYLIWNLLLAWMPLFFALLSREHFATTTQRNWRLAGLTILWLLFFPNAPYIFTDVIHAARGTPHHFWVDLTLILSCALTGFIVGFVSLYLMQALVARVHGRIVSWLFVAAVAGLSGFGVYLGRILRFNSWDVIARPIKLFNGINTWATDPLANLNTSVFPILFAVFLFLAYVMLYALTHLRPAPLTVGSNENELAQA